MLSAPSLRSVWVAFCRYWRRVSVQRRQRATQVMAAPGRARRATAPQRRAKRSSERWKNTKTKIERRAKQVGSLLARLQSLLPASTSVDATGCAAHSSLHDPEAPQRRLWLGPDEIPPLQVFYCRPPHSCTILILRSADLGSQLYEGVNQITRSSKDREAGGGAPSDSRSRSAVSVQTTSGKM